MNDETLQCRLLGGQDSQGDLDGPRATSEVNDLARSVLFRDLLTEYGVSQMDMAWLVPGEVEKSDPLAIVGLTSTTEILQ